MKPIQLSLGPFGPLIRAKTLKRTLGADDPRIHQQAIHSSGEEAEAGSQSWDQRLWAINQPASTESTAVDADVYSLTLSSRWSLHVIFMTL